MLTEQEIRARFPISQLKFDDDQLRILERFTPLRSYKDGETLVAVGTRSKLSHHPLGGSGDSVFLQRGAAVFWENRTERAHGRSLTTLGKSVGPQQSRNRRCGGFRNFPGNSQAHDRSRAEAGNIILAALIARSQILRDLNLSPLQRIGSRFSADTFRIRDFFAKNRVFFSWIDIENDPNMEELLKRLKITEGDTPVVAFGNQRTCVILQTGNSPESWAS